MTPNWSNGRIALVSSAAAGCLAVPSSVEAQGSLFDSSQLVHVRIEAPFRSMISEKEGRFPARLVVDLAPEDTIRLEIAPRGKSRLNTRICDFPGLMLFFPDGARGTLFENQGPVPVVSHCRDRDSYEQLAVLEYLAYRVYNIVTELSLQVRLARFEYFDSERERLVAERLGFFLENYDVMAERSGWVRLEVPLVPPDAYEADQRALFEVFQYFIGNTDWSYSKAAPDEDVCCHNSVPVGDNPEPLFPVPFDLDHAGLVDAPYATVNQSLPIRTVRERLYRGFCDDSRHLNRALGIFEASESEIRALFAEADLLSERNRRKALRYVDEFYSTIADDRRVQREFISRCRTR